MMCRWWVLPALPWAGLRCLPSSSELPATLCAPRATRHTYWPRGADLHGEVSYRVAVYRNAVKTTPTCSDRFHSSRLYLFSSGKCLSSTQYTTLVMISCTRTEYHTSSTTSHGKKNRNAPLKMLSDTTGTLSGMVFKGFGRISPPSASHRPGSIQDLRETKTGLPHLPPPIILSSASRCSCMSKSCFSFGLGRIHGSDLDLACAAPQASCGETRGCAARPKTPDPACGGLLPSSTWFGFASRLAGAFRDGACGCRLMSY